MSKLFLSKKMDMEYLTVDGLEKRTGVNSTDFDSYILKELLDNAIDSCEESGKTPKIKISIQNKEDAATIELEDNGEGISEENLKTIFDFSRFSGTKYYRKNVTRGAQGNALMTVLGIPYALASEENKKISCPVEIVSRGNRHKISVEYDSVLQEVKTTIDSAPIKNKDGRTTIKVNLPIELDEDNLKKIINGFALWNPHIEIECTYSDDFEEPKAIAFPAREYKRYYGAESIHWYNEGNFKELVFATIRYLEEHKEKMSLIAFAKTFKGLTSNKITGSIKGRCKWLNGLKTEKEILAWFKELKTLCKAPKPRILGALGKEHFLRYVAGENMVNLDYGISPEEDELLESVGARDKAKTKFINELTTKEEEKQGLRGGGISTRLESKIKEKKQSYGSDIKDYNYKKIEGTFETNIPFVLETFVCKTNNEEREVLFGINNTITYELPLKNQKLSMSNWGIDTYWATIGIEGTLDAMKITSDKPFFVSIHLTCPNIIYTGYGKSSFESEFVVAALEESIAKCCKEYHKKLKREERSKNSYDRLQEQEQKASERNQKTPLKDIFFNLLPTAIENESEGGTLYFTQRNLFYRMRPMIQEQPCWETWGNEKKDYAYFKTNLAQYEISFGKVEKLVRESSGFLFEPHTENKVDLATDEVEKYIPPNNLFNKLIYIEKKGLVKLLIQNNFHRKYDVALVGTSGKANFGAKDLLKKMNMNKSIKLFILHDCDIDGYEIALTTKQESSNYKDYSIEAIDMGLKYADVKRLGLKPEKQLRKNNAAGIVKEYCSEEELKWLMGNEDDYNTTKNGTRYKFIANRVELNALGTRGLMNHLEKKLEEYGVKAKVLPEDSTLKNKVAQKKETEIRDLISRQVAQLLNLDNIEESLFKEISKDYKIGFEKTKDHIEGRLKDFPTTNWEGILNTFVSNSIANNKGTNKKIEEKTIRLVLEAFDKKRKKRKKGKNGFMYMNATKEEGI